jgi:putative chitinase
MNTEVLMSIIPRVVIDKIPLVMDKFTINTPLRLAHFLAQVSHESGIFKVSIENLNYSAKGLLATFPKYFDVATATAYEKKPEKIANLVYANRMGNGDKSSGDGYKFRGRGYIQLTGHDNYASFDAIVEDDILLNPDLVATKYQLLSAAWFWNRSKLNSISDMGDTDDIVKKITRKVNGGVIGLDDRIKHFHEYYKLLS